MSTKREIQRWDPGVTDMKTGKVKLHRCNIGEFVLYKHHEAARAKDAELIQMLVDALADHSKWCKATYDSDDYDPTPGACSCGKFKREVQAMHFAASAGFKPIEK